MEMKLMGHPVSCESVFYVGVCDTYKETLKKIEERLDKEIESNPALKGGARNGDRTTWDSLMPV
jgi:hypothetical protein